MWIQVEDTIREHDKIYNLSDELGIPDAYAIGLMVCLWTWASSNAPDGDLTSFPPRAIASAAKWGKAGAKAASRFYDALLEVQFLEKLEDGRIVIRNWEKRATLIMDYVEQQREKTNERVKRYRDRKKKQKSISEIPEKPSSNVSQSEKCNVTDTLQNGDVTPMCRSCNPAQIQPRLLLQQKQRRNLRLLLMSFPIMSTFLLREGSCKLKPWKFFSCLRRKPFPRQKNRSNRRSKAFKI